MSIRLVSTGDWKKTSNFLNRMAELFKRAPLDKYGRMGVDALRAATPKKTGVTANSWSYKINHSRGQTSIEWYNTNENKDVKIAIILQYGHGTRNGGYVKGTDYINPAMRNIFNDIADQIWREVTKS